MTPADLTRLTGARQPEQDFITAVCDYQDQKVRDVVYAGKFSGAPSAIRLIGQTIHQELLAICQEERIFADEILITPIPLTRRRQRERGFNQSSRICEAVAQADCKETFRHEGLLEKTQETADQTELSRTARRSNVANSFRAKVDEVDTEVIFVIDDVTTTGATLVEARRALRKVTDAKIIGAAFAH